MLTFDYFPALVKKHFPDAVVEVCDHLGPRCGFHVKLGNGYTVSVQCGPFTYSSHHDSQLEFENAPAGGWVANATLAELAVFLPEGGFFPLEDNDNVRGYCTVEETLELVAEVAKYGNVADKK